MIKNILLKNLLDIQSKFFSSTKNLTKKLYDKLEQCVETTKEDFFIKIDCENNLNKISFYEGPNVSSISLKRKNYQFHDFNSYITLSKNTAEVCSCVHKKSESQHLQNFLSKKETLLLTDQESKDKETMIQNNFFWTVLNKKLNHPYPQKIKDLSQRLKKKIKNRNKDYQKIINIGKALSDFSNLYVFISISKEKITYTAYLPKGAFIIKNEDKTLNEIFEKCSKKSTLLFKKHIKFFVIQHSENSKKEMFFMKSYPIQEHTIIIDPPQKTLTAHEKIKLKKEINNLLNL